MFARIKAWFKKVFSHAVIIEAPPTQFPEPNADGPQLPSADDKGKVRLAVIVGHEKAAQGAQMPSGLTEYKFNTMVASKMKEFAAKMGNIEVEIIFRDGVGISGTYAEARKRLCDVAIELHFNAFNGKVAGSEVLCTPDVSDVEFAHVILRQICAVFKRSGESRGVKTIAKSARGGGNVHSFPGGANCLVEPFFGDNPVEAAIAMQNIDRYAQALVSGVLLWARQVDLIRS